MHEALVGPQSMSARRSELRFAPGSYPFHTRHCLRVPADRRDWHPRQSAYLSQPYPRLTLSKQQGNSCRALRARHCPPANSLDTETHLRPKTGHQSRNRNHRNTTFSEPYPLISNLQANRRHTRSGLVRNVCPQGGRVAENRRKSSPELTPRQILHIFCFQKWLWRLHPTPELRQNQCMKKPLALPRGPMRIGPGGEPQNGRKHLHHPTPASP